MSDSCQKLNDEKAGNDQEAGPKKVQPLILTSLTTMLALGRGLNFFAPYATATAATATIATTAMTQEQDEAKASLPDTGDQPATAK